MSKFNAPIFVCLLAAVLSACATTKIDEHAAHTPAGDASTAAAMPMQGMQPMQQNMQMMREQMAKIHAAQDPAERKRLMSEHQHAMQEQMRMMHGMMGGQMKGQMMGGKGSEKDGMMSHDMMQHHQMMMGRMDMMQSMMEQMMEHMAAEQSGAPDMAKKKP
jgi:hypothetical protein